MSSKSPDHPTAADVVDQPTVWTATNDGIRGVLHCEAGCRLLQRANKPPEERDPVTFPLAWTEWCSNCGPEGGV